MGTISSMHRPPLIPNSYLEPVQTVPASTSSGDPETESLSESPLVRRRRYLEIGGQTRVDIVDLSTEMGGSGHCGVVQSRV